MLEGPGGNLVTVQYLLTRSVSEEVAGAKNSNSKISGQVDCTSHRSTVSTLPNYYALTHVVCRKPSIIPASQLQERHHLEVSLLLSTEQASYQIPQIYHLMQSFGRETSSRCWAYPSPPLVKSCKDMVDGMGANGLGQNPILSSADWPILR
jgi:hypothetical protein